MKIIEWAEEGNVTVENHPEATVSAGHARVGPKWEAAARERVRAGIRRYSKPLADLVARDANEGDTRLLVTDFLCDAL